MKENNGHIGGVEGYGETYVEILTSKEGVVKLILSGLPVQDKGKKFRYTGIIPGTKDTKTVVGHEIKNNGRK